MLRRTERLNQSISIINLSLDDHIHLQPRSQGPLLPVPTERERERDPGWVWSRGPRTKLIPSEESFVSQFFVWFVYTVHTMIETARFAKPPTITEIREIPA